ncbi:MAG TPA: hypothetical protein VN721_10630, partial [Flavipsychrobacter sp.]|nr:hypothetical protein [Flavipsychrobacter sp.]
DNPDRLSELFSPYMLNFNLSSEFFQNVIFGRNSFVNGPIAFLYKNSICSYPDYTWFCTGLWPK